MINGALYKHEHVGYAVLYSLIQMHKAQRIARSPLLYKESPERQLSWPWNFVRVVSSDILLKKKHYSHGCLTSRNEVDDYVDIQFTTYVYLINEMVQTMD